MVYAVPDSSWDEHAITWNEKPAYRESLGSVGVTANVPGAFVGVDLTAYVQAARQAGRSSVSVMLRAPVHTSAYVSFDAREAGETGPQLVISR